MNAITATRVVSVILLLTGVGAAHADITYMGEGGTIRDSSKAGIGSVRDFSLFVADSFTIDQLSSVTLNGFTHAWAGDISVELFHNGVGVTLVHRVGYLGGSSFGDSSNYAGDYTFTDATNNSLWAAADLGASSFVIPSASYFASAAGGFRVGIADVFDGMSAQGMWTLRIIDWAPTQTGSLEGWSFTTVPAPGALLGLGLAGFSRHRRRN